MVSSKLNSMSLCGGARRIAVGFLAAAVILPAAIVAQFQASEMFWSTHSLTTNRIYKANIDGTGVQVLVDMTTSTLGDDVVFSDLSLDVQSERMYAAAGNKIMSWFLNGTDMQVSYTDPNLHCIGLDVDTFRYPRRIYFSSLFQRTIFKATLTSDYMLDDVTVAVPALSTLPYHVALDRNDDVFFSTRLVSPRSSLEQFIPASGKTTLVQNIGAPNSLAVDTFSSTPYLYFGDAAGGVLKRVPLGVGAAPDLVAQALSTSPATGGVAVDSAHGKVYWIEQGDGVSVAGKIHSAMLDGSMPALVHTQSATVDVPIALAINAITPSPTPTPSSSVTPSHTASQTPTHSPTPSFGSSKSPTSSRTATASTTSSSSATATPSATPSVTASRSVSPSANSASSLSATVASAVVCLMVAVLVGWQPLQL